ncbi:hypothetical protein EZV62_000664 [Acer yangbiense]|uniref:Bifunctional inhibitor/plant lipid transfer protein/seed storage helical domain-containing protein n=1 Tax=Acer yangbiense TaxID=1000413 RepID=A0A5C7ISA0_9ROSI|nr:hypothetical protein EZV62_000664 [Acer yangbiense]
MMRSENQMTSKEMGLVMVLTVTVTVLSARAIMAQSDCTNVLIGLAPCLNYVSGSSSTPSASCCSQLASVVRSQPRCLCTVLSSGGASLGVTINQTLALALPGACNVQTPPVSRCNGKAKICMSAANGPVMSPFGSPVGSPEALPGDDTTAAATGSKTENGTSNKETLKIPLQLVSFFLFMASFAFTV